MTANDQTPRQPASTRTPFGDPSNPVHPESKQLPVDVDQRARNKRVGGEQSNGEDALVDSEGRVSGYEKVDESTDTSSN